MLYGMTTEKVARAAYYAIGVACTVAGVGFGAAKYLDGFEPTNKVVSAAREHRVVHNFLTRDVASHGERLARVEATLEHIQQQTRWLVAVEVTESRRSRRDQTPAALAEYEDIIERGPPPPLQEEP